MYMFLGVGREGDDKISIAIITKCHTVLFLDKCFILSTIIINDAFRNVHNQIAFAASSNLF